jgi:hypothetical protein
MCCRISIQPAENAIALSILEIGSFRPVLWLPGRDYAVNWEREISEEGTVVSASLADASLELSISPSVNSFDHHHGKLAAAGVLFEIGAKYAERVSGEITQRALISGCKEHNAEKLIVAHYPYVPLSFQAICPGFQALIVNSH